MLTGPAPLSEITALPFGLSDSGISHRQRSTIVIRLTGLWSGTCHEVLVAIRCCKRDVVKAVVGQASTRIGVIGIVPNKQSLLAGGSCQNTLDGIGPVGPDDVAVVTGNSQADYDGQQRQCDHGLYHGEAGL